MDIEKIEEFAKEGDKNLDNFDVVVGFVQAEKPERQWFNKILNIITSKINQIIDYVDSINDGFFESIDSARLESPSLDVSSMITRSYSGNRKGGGRYIRSSIGEVSQYPEQAWFRTADGAYWLLDEKQPTPEMFGAKGDLSYDLIIEGSLPSINSVTKGHRYISGTNDIEAFNAAMRYAIIRKVSVVANGDYYIKSFNRNQANGITNTFPIDFKYKNPADIIVHVYDPDGDAALVNPTSAERADAQHKVLSPSEFSVVGNTVVLNTVPASDMQVEVCQTFTVEGDLTIKGTLWTHYALPSQGVFSNVSNSRYTATLTIGQYSYNGFKPANNGQYGTILCVGSGFLLPTDHILVDDVVMKSELIRAARVLGDPTNNILFQDSDASQMCIGIGNIRNVVFEVDPFDAATNTISLMLCLFHWGGRYTPPAGEETADKGAYPIEKSWHPEACELITTKTIKNSDHGFFKGFELASTINCTVSDFKCDGLTHVYWVGIGDLAGAYAQGNQKGRVNTGNKAGHIVGNNINVGSEIYAALFKGEGTSKFEKYAGTDQFLQRQDVMDWTVKSHTIKCVSGNEVMRMRGVRGRVDTGVLNLYGCPISMYVLSGTGKLDVDIAGSDGVLRVQNFKGLNLKRSNIDLGNTRNNTANGLYEKGYEAGNCTVHLQGGLYTTTTTASISAGDTNIPIAAFSSAFAIVSPNDLLIIKSGTDVIEVRSTGFVVAGGLSVPCTPVPKALPTGATVTLDLKVEADYVNMTSKSSEYGLYSENAVIKKLDFSEMGWSGRNSAKMYNTQATMVGRLPSSDARRITTASDQGIWTDKKCRIVALNGYFPANSDGDEAIFLQTDAGEGATITLIGGVVENVNTFAPSAAFPMNQIHFNGVVDTLGQLVIPRGRSGSNANGYWVKHPDGTMECWARNVTVGATQPYVWTFPTPFIDTASTFVTATGTNATTSRVGNALSTSATTANVWLTDNNATATPSVSTAGMNLYAKGFWRLTS